MKKIITAFIISILTISGASAQNQEGVFSLGGTLSYGTEIESLGVGLRAQYGFTSYIRGAGEYKYYIDRHSTSAWGFTGDFHYVIPVASAASLYPIGGITFSRWTNDPGRIKIEGISIDAPKTSHNRIGFNLGLGGEIAMGSNSFLQIEAKEAFIKDFTQFVITVGYMYRF